MTPTLTGEPHAVQDRSTARRDAADPESLVVTRLRTAGHIVLAMVAVIGAALSYTSLQTAAAGVFHRSVLAYGFPLLVDALILGASLQYVAGARAHTPGRAGWRATAHAAIAATLLLNALAAFTPNGGGPAAVPWHVTAPAAWAVLVELYARTAAGQWRTDHAETGAGIPLRLWLTAPLESARTWLRQERLSAAVAARYDVGRHAAALEALHLTLPGRSGRRVRAVLRRQLRTGSITPDTVLAACGWHHPDDLGEPLDPCAVLRAALAGHSLESAEAPGAPSAHTLQPINRAASLVDVPAASLPPVGPGAASLVEVPAASLSPVGPGAASLVEVPAASLPPVGPGAASLVEVPAASLPPVGQGSPSPSADDATLHRYVRQARAERPAAGELAVRRLLTQAGLTASSRRIRAALAVSAAPTDPHPARASDQTANTPALR